MAAQRGLGPGAKGLLLKPESLCARLLGFRGLRLADHCLAAQQGRGLGAKGRLLKPHRVIGG
jgi:hypothetical protein